MHRNLGYPSFHQSFLINLGQHTDSPIDILDTMFWTSFRKTLQITARNQGDLNFMELVLRVAAATQPEFLVPTKRHRIGNSELLRFLDPLSWSKLEQTLVIVPYGPWHIWGGAEMWERMVPWIWI